MARASALWHNRRMVASPAGRWSTWSARLNRRLLGNDESRLEVGFRLPFVWLAGLLTAALLLPDRIWTTFLVASLGLVVVSFFWARALARGVFWPAYLLPTFRRYGTDTGELTSSNEKAQMRIPG